MENETLKSLLLNDPNLEDIIPAYFFEGALKLNFKNEFQKFAPEMYADLESAYHNANCTCMTKIKLFAKENKESFVGFLLKFVEKFSNEEDLQDKIENKSKNIKQVYLGGTVLKTKISNWKDFSNKISGSVYRSFSVVKEGDELLVFFL